MAAVPMFDALPDTPVAVVTLTAPWCAPWKMLEPMLAAFAAEHPDVTVGAIDVDAHPALVTQLHIQVLPVTVILDHGNVVSKRVGAVTKADLADAAAGVRRRSARRTTT